MSIINLIRTSIYSLKSHKLRVFLTMIGIIIGISSVVAILSIGNGLKTEINKSMTDISANKINVNFEPNNVDGDLSLIEPFSKSDSFYLRKVVGVEKVEVAGGTRGLRFIAGEGTYFDKKAYIMLESYDNKEINVKYGRSFKEGENSKKLIILDGKSAKTLFNSLKNAIGCGITVKGVIYEVIGVLEEPGTLSLNEGSSYISKDSKEDMNSDTLISGLDVYIKVGEDKDKVFQDIKRELMGVHPKLEGTYTFQDPQTITKAFEKMIGGLTAFIALVSGISLFVGGIGLMNIMYVFVSERKREIGIRRAIGASPKSILLQFLLEAILVTGIGGLIGMIFGYIFSKSIGIFLTFPPVLTLGNVGAVTLTSVLIGIIFGIIPAINASKIDPIKAIYK